MSRSGLLSFPSPSSPSSSWLSPASVTVRGVSAPHVLGVCPPLAPFAATDLKRVLRADEDRPGTGVMTSVSLLPASRIHFLSLLSNALRYSRWASVSASPGKKSRRMMCEIADVYVSSFKTIDGLFMRLGAGGGAMRAVEALRLVTALEVLSEAMIVS